MTENKRYAHSLHRFVRFVALLVGAVGVVVLFGWIFGIAAVTTLAPGLASMKVNTACGFLAAGMALWLSSTPRPGTRPATLALAAGIAAIGGLTLAEDLFHLDLGIDQLLHQDRSAAADVFRPGRMAPGTALCFLFIGIALLLIHRRSKPSWWARATWYANVPMVVSAVALAGYAYGVSVLYKVGPYSSMAAHTAICFFVLSLAVIAADPSRGIARIVSSDTVAGTLARRLLLTIPVILFVIGWLTLAGQTAGLYGTAFGLALMVIASIAVCVIAVRSTAMALDSADVKRRKAEAELVSLNTDLERRVQERTEQLEESLAQVRQLDGLLPICAWCKKIRDDQDYWQTLEKYVTDRTDASFTHGICPACHDKVLADGIREPEASLRERISDSARS